MATTHRPRREDLSVTLNIGKEFPPRLFAKKQITSAKEIPKALGITEMHVLTIVNARGRYPCVNLRVHVEAMQMKSSWVHRRAHQRRSKSGGTTAVRATWELRPVRNKGRAGAYRHSCPHCGEAVISVRMKRGGWAHFEGAEGLGRVKHRCFHTGEGLSRRRDNETPDLFEKLMPPGDTHVLTNKESATGAD